MAASRALDLSWLYEVNTSSNRPGVATRMSMVLWYRTQSASRAICGSSGTPPCNTMVEKGLCLLRLSMAKMSSTIWSRTSPICTHNSRVGHRTRAVTRSPFCVALVVVVVRSTKMFCSRGIRKAAVFPLPVGASHQKASVASFSISRGMANFCTGVGYSQSRRDQMALSTDGWIPSLEKDTSSSVLASDVVARSGVPWVTEAYCGVCWTTKENTTDHCTVRKRDSTAHRSVEESDVMVCWHCSVIGMEWNRMEVWDGSEWINRKVWYL
mmetsp:Transcript_17995/g.49957  ORF Transcript_17995/g.49957 Transcript_17995/m.49957 type:complete len:268 (+) Transcript_17995:1186-1989(+)